MVQGLDPYLIYISRKSEQVENITVEIISASVPSSYLKKKNRFEKSKDHK